MLFLAVAVLALVVLGLLAIASTVASARRPEPRAAGLDLVGDYGAMVERFESRLHAGTLPDAGDVATMFLNRDPRAELHLP